MKRNSERLRPRTLRRARNVYLALVLLIVCSVSLSCGGEEETQQAASGEPGSLIVQGDGQAQYSVYDADGTKIDQKYTNRSLELLPGSYQVELHGTRIDATVESGRQTVAATTGTLIVQGEGQIQYAVYDADGKKIDQKYTDRVVEVLPGAYEVDVRGTRIDVSVESGRQSVAATTGTLIVQGEGQIQYAIFDADGKKIDQKYTDRIVELLPGAYEVDVHGTRIDATVESGRQTVAATTGSLIVQGEGQIQYAVFDTAGKKIDQKYTDRVIELLPGSYEVDVRGTRIEATVESARQTVAAITGSVVLQGDGRTQYSVFDAEGKKLDQKYTNRSVELLPGSYVIGFNDREFGVEVKPGEETTISS